MGTNKPWLEMASHLTGRCLVLFWIISPRASMALSSIETMAGSAVMMSRTGVRSGGMSNAITRLIHENRRDAPFATYLFWVLEPLATMQVLVLN